jgi:hypothetical protein
MIAGTVVMRTTNASPRTPKANAKPIGLMKDWCEKMNPPNTLIMMMAAAVTTRALWRKPMRGVGNDHRTTARAWGHHLVPSGG